MRQQLEQLDRLEREAGLSQREMEVCRRHRQGMEEVEIAADLNITRNNDYVIKRNAIRRLTEARKAAGF